MPEPYIVIESPFNRVTADGDGLEFQQVNVYYRPDQTAAWEEVLVWDAEEWRTPGMEAFEAILGIIGTIARGGRVTGVQCSIH